MVAKGTCISALVEICVKMASQGYFSSVLPSSIFVVHQIPLQWAEGKRRHQTILQVRTLYHINDQVNSAVFPEASVQEGGNLCGDNFIFDIAVIFLQWVLLCTRQSKYFKYLWICRYLLLGNVLWEAPVGRTACKLSTVQHRQLWDS